MATADAETTVVPETDIHHHQLVEKKTTEDETANELMIPASNKDGSVKQLEEEEEAPTEDKLAVVTDVNEPPKLDEEVPAKTCSKQVTQESEQPEAVTTAQVQALEAAEIEANNKMVPEEAAEIVPQEKPTMIPEENPELDDDGVAEETTEKPAVEAALEGELEERPHLDSVRNTKEEVVEGEVQHMLEAEEKTESLAVESESKEVPTLEADENQPKESAEIEANEKCEGEAVNPITTTEAADEQVQTMEDVPVQESNLDIKKGPEETLKTQSLEAEAEQTNGIDEVVDASKGKPREVKDDAEEVEAKITEEVAEEDGTISAAPKSIIIAETSVPQVESGLRKFVSELENTVAEEINNAAHENVAVEEIASEDGKVEEGNQGKDANVENVGSLNEREEVPDGSFEGKQVSRDLEVLKVEEAKELEEEKTCPVEPEIGSKDPPTVEETVVANESQPTMATAAQETKPDPSTLEDSKDIGEHDTKAKQELSTITEVVIKSTHKSSGDIISKMKRSLVKVKKAITGKSPSSKTSSAAKSKGEEKGK